MAALVNPFYTDWTFWAALLSLVAIVLSQMPPIHLLLRPKRLDVEVHSRILISHDVGNPNAAVVIGISNTGGRELRVRALRLLVHRDGNFLTQLAGRSFFETPSSQAAVLFVPFSLKPGETWSHSVSFFSELDRQAEKRYRENVSLLRGDINRLLANQTSPAKGLVEAAPELVAPFSAMFERLFIWEPGEYVVKLEVNAEPGSASFIKEYRFTLFESDTKDLKHDVDSYKTGAGIYFRAESLAHVNVPLSGHAGK